MRTDFLSMLWNYANGRFPRYVLYPDHGPVGWGVQSHRGIQRLDRIHIPAKQKRFVWDAGLEVRYDQCFEQVVRSCAQGRAGTWLGEDLIRGYVRLYQRGFAHSLEAWRAGRLVAGSFVVQIGGYVSGVSMFHHEDNACKASYVRNLLELRDRGFRVVDVIANSPFFAMFGGEWVPHWHFQKMLPGLLPQRLTFTDGSRPASLPGAVRFAMVPARIVLGLNRRLRTVPAAAQAAVGAETSTSAALKASVLSH